jgi:hypothetical protein
MIEMMTEIQTPSASPEKLSVKVINPTGFV